MAITVELIVNSEPKTNTGKFVKAFFEKHGEWIKKNHTVSCEMTVFVEKPNSKANEVKKNSKTDATKKKNNTDQAKNSSLIDEFAFYFFDMFFSPKPGYAGKSYVDSHLPDSEREIIKKWIKKDENLYLYYKAARETNTREFYGAVLNEIGKSNPGLFTKIKTEILSHQKDRTQSPMRKNTDTLEPELSQNSSGFEFSRSRSSSQSAAMRFTITDSSHLSESKKTTSLESEPSQSSSNKSQPRPSSSVSPSHAHAKGKERHFLCWDLSNVSEGVEKEEKMKIVEVLPAAPSASSFSSRTLSPRRAAI